MIEERDISVAMRDGTRLAVDVYRPAAREQLKVVAQAIKANIYEGKVEEANTATVERLAKEARKEAINKIENAKDIWLMN